jgi:hypothetical protein
MINSIMIDQLKILLGASLVDSFELDDTTIHTAISLSAAHYLRFRPNTNPDWGTSPRAFSWIMDYALMQCKLILGEARMLSEDDRMTHSGCALTSTALRKMDDLEKELSLYG